MSMLVRRFHMLNVQTSSTAIDLALDAVEETHARLARIRTGPFDREGEAAVVAAFKEELRALVPLLQPAGGAGGGGGGAVLPSDALGVHGSTIATPAQTAKEVKAAKAEVRAIKAAAKAAAKAAGGDKERKKTAYQMYTAARLPDVRAANPTAQFKEFMKLASVGWDKAKYAAFSAAETPGIAEANPDVEGTELVRLVVAAYIADVAANAVEEGGATAEEEEEGAGSGTDGEAKE
jgi:hypothetical protein